MNYGMVHHDLCRELFTLRIRTEKKRYIEPKQQGSNVGKHYRPAYVKGIKSMS